jgi:Rnl2 family RNA ligase
MNPQEFVPYPKIAERLDAGEAVERALARAPWVVTEKIHGANLALISDGGDAVRGAKRKALLAPDEEFFGWTSIVARLADPVRALVGALRSGDPDLVRVIVYGELFGGAYPHPDVPPVPGVEPVQTGVWYAPDIQWRAFDIGLVRGDGVTLLDWEQAEPRLAAAAIPYLRPRLIGKINEAQNYPLGFETAIPVELGLPRITGNRAEGIVIKPLRAPIVDGQPVAPRLKRKLAEFAEDERFHGAQKWGSPARDGADAYAALVAAARARINEPRLHAARSKIGRIRPGDRKRRAELQATIVDDILDEIATTHKKPWGRASKSERERLRVELAADVAQLIDRLLG